MESWQVQGAKPAWAQPSSGHKQTKREKLKPKAKRRFILVGENANDQSHHRKRVVFINPSHQHHVHQLNGIVFQGVSWIALQILRHVLRSFTD